MPPTPTKTPNALLHGALDALILKTLTRGPSHGYAVARFIEDTTGVAFLIEDGSLYPPFIDSNERAGLRRSGELPNWAAGRSCIALRMLDASNSPPRWR